MAPDNSSRLRTRMYLFGMWALVYVAAICAFSLIFRTPYIAPFIAVDPVREKPIKVGPQISCNGIYITGPAIPDKECNPTKYGKQIFCGDKTNLNLCFGIGAG